MKQHREQPEIVNRCKENLLCTQTTCYDGICNNKPNHPAFWSTVKSYDSAREEEHQGDTKVASQTACFSLRTLPRAKPDKNLARSAYVIKNTNDDILWTKILALNKADMTGDIVYLIANPGCGKWSTFAVRHHRDTTHGSNNESTYLAHILYPNLSSST